MNLSDLNDLDINNIAGWPLPARVFVIALVFVAVLGLGYWFDIKEQQLSLEKAEAKEGDKKGKKKGTYQGKHQKKQVSVDERTSSNLKAVC